ncbi:hypothetical protein B0H11DRAFT_802875 [Mycena galericulata]|nr:hypothetical protein B0H11DRAFT_802875 [Mycena galericulata]
MDEDEDQTESGDEQQESEVDERLLYHKFMMNFGRPAGRPSFKDLQPIHKLASKYSTTLEVSTQDLPTTRRTLYCPKRTLWCGGQHLHALVFAPTQEYWYSTDSWTDKTKMRAYCGETFEFFVNKAGFTYYAGAYVVHSLRDVHPPGSNITTDVSRLAIHRATGLSQNHADKVKECFPDGEIKTECFGLQCVGFNQAVYRTLRERFTGTSGVDDRKRKAGSEDLRGEGGKSQRVF